MHGVEAIQSPNHFKPSSQTSASVEARAAGNAIKFFLNCIYKPNTKYSTSVFSAFIAQKRTFSAKFIFTGVKPMVFTHCHKGVF
jgi:hypothetical protein